MIFDPYGYDLSRQQPQLPLPAAAQAANHLLGIPQEARDVYWRGLSRALEGALTLWEQTPPGVKREPPIFTVQHAGRPAFDKAMLRQQSLENWHRLMGLELRIGVQALEALTQEEEPRYRQMLDEMCTRVGQLYREMERRTWAWFAKALLIWELQMLLYRASPTVGPLVYD